MKSSDFGNGAPGRSRATSAVSPTECPVCQSSSISTTARNPDENTYWRCSGCGEIWNASRRDSLPRGGYRWK